MDCGDAESRKLCKKMKVDLSPKDKAVELFHYQDGAFHTEYNRALTFKSIVAFLKDPKGPRCGKKILEPRTLSTSTVRRTSDGS